MPFVKLTDEDMQFCKNFQSTSKWISNITRKETQAALQREPDVIALMNSDGTVSEVSREETPDIFDYLLYDLKYVDFITIDDYDRRVGRNSFDDSTTYYDILEEADEVEKKQLEEHKMQTSDNVFINRAASIGFCKMLGKNQDIDYDEDNNMLIINGWRIKVYATRVYDMDKYSPSMFVNWESLHHLKENNKLPHKFVLMAVWQQNKVYTGSVSFVGFADLGNFRKDNSLTQSYNKGDTLALSKNVVIRRNPNGLFVRKARDLNEDISKLAEAIQASEPSDEITNSYPDPYMDIISK